MTLDALAKLHEQKQQLQFGRGVGAADDAISVADVASSVWLQFGRGVGAADDRSYRAGQFEDFDELQFGRGVGAADDVRGGELPQLQHVASIRPRRWSRG